MGWYADFRIGKLRWGWKYYYPPELALLFTGRHSRHPAEPESAGSAENEAFVGFRTSATAARKALDELGLTLAYFESIYGERREGFVNFNSAFFEGWLASATALGNHPRVKRDASELREDLRRVADSLSELRAGDAKRDVASAIGLLRAHPQRKWNPILHSDQEYHHFLPTASCTPPGELGIDGVSASFALASFVEYAREHLPEVGFLFTLRLLLETVGGRTQVELDLRGYAENGGDVEATLRNSVDGIIDKVALYERTFDALRGGKSTIGRELRRRGLVDAWRSARSARSNQEKGRSLETFFSALVECSHGLTVLDTRLRTQDQEIDLVLKNAVERGFWTALQSPVILVECKNWSDPVGIPEARVFESKLRELGSHGRLGVFLAMNGVTSAFSSHLGKLRRDGLYPVVIGREDVDILLGGADVGVIDWLENRIGRHIAGGTS